MQLANIRSDLIWMECIKKQLADLQSNQTMAIDSSSVAMHLIKKKTNRYYAVTHHNDYDN